MSKYILIIISTFLYTVQTNACREHVGFKNYPISQTKMFKHLVILKISHTEPTKKDIVQEENVVVLSYGKPFKFTATVLKSFKGTLKIGDEINGITSYDQEPNAVCPTNLMENETYIVMLNELNKQFIYNRYHTFVVSSEHGRYNQYIEELNVNFK